MHYSYGNGQKKRFFSACLALVLLLGNLSFPVMPAMAANDIVSGNAITTTDLEVPQGEQGSAEGEGSNLPDERGIVSGENDRQTQEEAAKETDLSGNPADEGVNTPSGEGGTTQGSGSSTEQGSGSGTTQGSGSSTEKGSGSGTTQGSGGGTTQGSGGGTEQGSGSGTTQDAGGSTEQGSGSGTTQDTGGSAEQGSGSGTEQGSGSGTTQDAGGGTEQGSGGGTGQGSDSRAEQGSDSGTEQGSGSSTEQGAGSEADKDATSQTDAEAAPEQTYTLIFDYNGGVDADGKTSYQVEVKKGDLFADYMKQAEAKNFVSPYVFANKWNIYETQTGELFDANRTVNIKRKVSGNYTCKAVWTTVYAKYSIGYELDGGAFYPYSGEYIPSSYSYLDLVTLPKQVEKKGFLFQGFYRNAAFTDGPVTTIPVQSFGDVKLYAKWQAAAPKKAPTLKKVTNSSTGKVKVTFKKMSGISGYELEMSRDAAFGNCNTMQLAADANSVQLTNMPKNETYYFRLHAYNLDSKGEKAYSPYSGVLKIAVKKGVQEYDAAADSAKQKACSVKKNTLTITYAVSKRVKSDDDSYYLVALNPYTNKYMSIVEQTIKQKNLTFTLPLRDDRGNDLIQTKFALAVRTGSTYKLISSGSFISNPQAAASYTKAFPSARTKKGLQIPQNEGAVSGLGLSHTFLNIDLNQVLKGANRKLYVYNGKAYYFNDPLKSTISQLNAQGVTVTAQIMLTYDEATNYMIVAGGRTPGKKYYAINVKDKKARETFEAAMSFLAESYSQKDCHIDNWILGNEVNMHSEWYYAGKTTKSTFMKQYAGAFRIMYYAVKSHSKNARSYICLDHTWTNYNGAWGAKPFMDSFHKEIKAQQADIQWNLAYHAYSSVLTNASVWNDEKATNSVNSYYVTPKNLEVLTNYVKKNFGKKTRIILSEQGFSSKKGEDLQAASLIYTYYKAEFNTMIDAVIFRSDIDNSVESAQGLYMGLQDIYGKKKKAYDVFKYMDTSKAAKYTKPYLQTIGIKKWKKIASGYTLSRFK